MLCKNINYLSLHNSLSSVHQSINWWKRWKRAYLSAAPFWKKKRRLSAFFYQRRIFLSTSFCSNLLNVLIHKKELPTADDNPVLDDAIWTICTLPALLRSEIPIQKCSHISSYFFSMAPQSTCCQVRRSSWSTWTRPRCGSSPSSSRSTSPSSRRAGTGRPCGGMSAYAVG